jgi:hypothetical protein
MPDRSPQNAAPISERISLALANRQRAGVSHG